MNGYEKMLKDAIRCNQRIPSEKVWGYDHLPMKRSGYLGRTGNLLRRLSEQNRPVPSKHVTLEGEDQRKVYDALRKMVLLRLSEEPIIRRAGVWKDPDTNLRWITWEITDAGREALIELEDKYGGD